MRGIAVTYETSANLHHTTRVNNPQDRNRRTDRGVQARSRKIKHLRLSNRVDEDIALRQRASATYEDETTRLFRNVGNPNTR